MVEYKRIAVDTSKSHFAIHAVDEGEQVVLRRDLGRGAFVAFIAKQAPSEFIFEACAGSHHWAREVLKRGHRVRLIPPQYVGAFRKRGKNDRADAAALNDAASRPDMASVPVKSVEQQADAVLLKVRMLLIRQRTQLANAVRGHAGEFGLVASKGRCHVPELLDQVAQSALPETAKEGLALLGERMAQPDAALAAVDRRLVRLHRTNPTSRRLEGQPGVGPVTALTAALLVDPASFSSGRHFAAWLGLVPRQHSTAGRPQLGRISKQGNEVLRSLLVNGAMAVISHARRGSKSASPWLLKLLERKPRKVAAVALANKMARVLWAMMARGEGYRPMPALA